jgi:hypothetical protein
VNEGFGFDIELETNEHEYECIFMKSQHAAGHGTGVDMYRIIRCTYRDERVMKIKPLSSFPEIYVASYGDHYFNSKACSARPYLLPAGKSCPIRPARMLAIIHMHLLLSLSGVGMHFIVLTQSMSNIIASPGWPGNPLPL